MIVLIGSAAMIVIACIAILVMYREAHENNVKTHVVHVSGLEQSVRLFFISDTHTRAIDHAMIAAIQPVDAVIIGGDFVDRRTSTETLLKNLQILKTLGPIYFVWGNNDRELPEEELLSIFREAHVTVIENEAILLTQLKHPLWLSAIDYVAEPRPDNIEKAFAKCEMARTIFVAHNPQVFPKVRAYYRPLLMMGGHLHGGQIRFGPFGMHTPGSFKERGGIPTLISNGYGTSLLPLRFGAKPECHVITMNFADDSSKNE
ncbi:MAG: metallophosphoesterase family protein [Solibacillus sp.]